MPEIGTVVIHRTSYMGHHFTNVRSLTQASLPSYCSVIVSLCPLLIRIDVLFV